jgi:DNA mismatch repair protein MutL
VTRRIQVLPDRVANQIAAGEVVERPASVVKELLENALDAGARRVEIHLEGGGRRTIRVSDDGSGMGREDALLCLDRHATSKIREAEDLRSVASYGFRGEALPSIASVSRLTLETRIRDEEVGTRVRVRGGAISAVEDLARTPGTTVTVENLFFNAPARAKFLRSAGAETRAAADAVTSLVLPRPDVGVTLTSSDRVLLDLPSAGDVVERIAALWGEEAAGELLPLEGEKGGMTIRGVVQRPDRARPGFRRAHLFVGGRPFRDAGLLAAADRGYRTTIPREHRPWLFLFLDVPAGGADVNVHPTKAEVRFRDRKGVEGLIEEAVRRALEGEESAATFDAAPDRPRLQVREEGRKIEPRPSDSQMALFLAGRDVGDGAGMEDEAEGARGPESASRDPEGGPVGKVAADSLTSAPGSEQAAERPRLWQVHQAWILAEIRDGLLLIDQHAAHERVLFERIMAGFQNGGEASQRLLFPLTVRLSPAEYDQVEEMKGLLHGAGFEVEGFGGDTVILHAVPSPHPYFDAEACFREIVDELTHGSELTRAARNQHERVAMSFACKAAIKAGQPLDEREIEELFDQLFATELPFHDVHGRPTTVRLPRAELERKFGR